MSSTRPSRNVQRVNYDEQLPTKPAKDSSEEDEDFQDDSDLGGRNSNSDANSEGDGDVGDSGDLGDNGDPSDEEASGDEENSDGEDSTTAGPGNRKRKAGGLPKTSPEKKRVRRQAKKQGPGPKTKNATTSRMFYAKALAGFDHVEDEIEKDTALASTPITPMEIESKANLVHLQMFKAVRNSLKLGRDVNPTRDDTVPLESFLNGPVVPGRRWTSYARPEGNASWMLNINDHAKPPSRNTAGHTLNYNTTLKISRTAVVRRADAEEIAEVYCKLMERIPFPVPARGNLGRSINAAYMTICIRYVIPNHDVELLAGYWKPRVLKSGGIEYAGKFKSIDPITGQAYLTKYQVNTANISLDKPLPALPAHFKTPTFSLSGKAVTQEEKRRERYAFDLVYYINSKLHNIVGSKDAVKAKKQLIAGQFMTSKHGKVGPFGGQKLYQLAIQTRSRRMLLSMSDPVKKSIQNTAGGTESLPTIRINGLARTHANKVVQVLTQTWMRTGDIFESWKAACTAADYLNMDGANDDQQGSTCSCTPEQRLTECHLCDLCGKIALCQTLAPNASGTALTCDDCRNRNPTFLRQSMKGNLAKEYRNLQLSSDRAIEEDEILMKLEENWDDEDQTWNSDYTDIAMSERLMGKRPRNPFTPSIDGVLPVFHYEKDDTGLRYHAPGNIAVCELYINQMKEQYPAGILHVMAEWANSDKTDADRQRVMAAMNDIHVVRRKIGGTLRRRLRRGAVDVDAWEDTKQELLTCKPGPGASDQSRVLWKYHSKAPDPTSKTWRPRECERVMRVIAEIEAMFADSNKVLQRSADGCPFPFPGEKMPADWCWWSAWATFEERLCRMWLLCNGYWVTFDNIETLFLDGIFQFFSPTDVDPFNLDLLSIFYGHPLRFAIARRIPGQAMQTAWTNPRPESVRDRGPTSTGNISFEPHIVNQMKMEFAEDTYGEMVTRTSRIKLSKKYYDPDYKSKSKAIRRTSLIEDDSSDFDDDVDEDFGDNLADGGDLFEYENEAEPDEDEAMTTEEDDENAEDEVTEIPETDYDSA